MKQITIVVGLFLSTLTVQAEEGCPADQAAAAGFVAFETFHHVMAPAWHQAWPDSDYTALLAAGPKFAEAFEAIEKLDPRQLSAMHRDAFTKRRRLFADLVQKYVEACRQSDSALVYELMPGLHDAFETTAATLLPVSYPEYEGMVVTLDLIVGAHLPENNMEGLVGSTETLLAKTETLITSSLPAELKHLAEIIGPRLEMMRQLVLHMLESLYQSNLKEYIIYATALKTQSDEFASLYL